MSHDRPWWRHPVAHWETSRWCHTCTRTGTSSGDVGEESPASCQLLGPSSSDEKSRNTPLQSPPIIAQKIRALDPGEKKDQVQMNVTSDENKHKSKSIAARTQNLRRSSPQSWQIDFFSTVDWGSAHRFFKRKLKDHHVSKKQLNKFLSEERFRIFFLSNESSKPNKRIDGRFINDVLHVHIFQNVFVTWSNEDKEQMTNRMLIKGY
jgi:hypothetical protein